jgi:hypothetical protein
MYAFLALLAPAVVPDPRAHHTKKLITMLQVLCMLLWTHAKRDCSPVTGILSALERKRRVFKHSPTTFWKLGSQPLNRELQPFSAWKGPFVVEDVFIPAPKTCSGCTEELPAGATVNCWQAASYMHCKCVIS